MRMTRFLATVSLLLLSSCLLVNASVKKSWVQIVEGDKKNLSPQKVQQKPQQVQLPPKTTTKATSVFWEQYFGDFNDQALPTEDKPQKGIVGPVEPTAAAALCDKSTDRAEKAKRQCSNKPDKCNALGQSCYFHDPESDPNKYDCLCITTRTIPLGFTSDQFRTFAQVLFGMLELGGITGVKAYIAGSSVQGWSYAKKAKRKTERVKFGDHSDYDVTLVSATLFQAAKEAGVKIHNKRTDAIYESKNPVPLPKSLAVSESITIGHLNDIAAVLGSWTGREVGFQIWGTEIDRFRPMIKIPTYKPTSEKDCKVTIGVFLEKFFPQKK